MSEEIGRFTEEEFQAQRDFIDSIFLGKDLSNPEEADKAFGQLHEQGLEKFGIDGLGWIYVQITTNEGFMNALGDVHLGALYNNIGVHLLTHPAPGPELVIKALHYFFNALAEDTKLGREAPLTSLNNISGLTGSILQLLAKHGPMTRQDVFNHLTLVATYLL